MLSARFEWIATEPSKNPIWYRRVGTELKHHGEQSVPVKLREGRTIWITFQVREVNGPNMSVGKFCTKVNDRGATFTTRGGVLWHEEAGEILVDRVRDHCELEFWIKPRNVLAPVQVGSPAGHFAAAPRRADAEMLMDAQHQGAHAPSADEEHFELEILQVASLPKTPRTQQGRDGETQLVA